MLCVYHEIKNVLTATFTNAKVMSSLALCRVPFVLHPYMYVHVCMHVILCM